MVKRAIDLIVASAGIVLLTPLLVLIAILIKVESQGPIFFKQERVGRSFRPILVYKFRTMIIGAATLGPRITSGRDQRITGIGQFLRRSKIDELPQLLNVLRGDMSLVGPRPEVPEYVEAYREHYNEILTIRPGMTDFASLKFFDEADLLALSTDPERFYRERVLPEKLGLARRYLRERSLRLDVILMARTLWRLLRDR